MLKLLLQGVYVVIVLSRLIWPRTGSDEEGSYEHGNEASCPVKDRNFCCS